MAKKVFYLFIAVTVACLISFSTTQAQNSLVPKIFQEDSLGYSIQYPYDWVYSKDDPMTIVFSGASGTRAWYSTVSIQNILSAKLKGKYKDLDELAEDLKGQFKTGAKNVAFSGMENFSYNKNFILSGKQFTAEYTDQGTRFKQWLILIARPEGGIFYAWFYTSRIEQYNEFLPAAKAMLGSWTILPVQKQPAN